MTNDNGYMPGVAKFANDGTALSGEFGYIGGGLSNPLGIAIDGAGNAWVTSDSTTYNTGMPVTYSSMVELNQSGTILSGATGYSLSSLWYPVGDAIDSSGNVWVVMAGDTVFELVGAATPVVTPLSIAVKNNIVGTRP